MSASPKIRILIVEDHPVFRQGLSMVIGGQPDMEVVAEAGTAEEALLEYRRHTPDITLMDQRMPGQTGTSAIIAIRKQFCSARVIMLTTSEGDAEIRGALCAGASAYLLKSTPSAELFATIRAVHEGRSHMPAAVASRLAAYLGQEVLSETELKILGLIQAGHYNQQIADQLSLPESDVNTHIQSLIKKLQANDRAHAISIAIRRGMLEI